MKVWDTFDSFLIIKIGRVVLFKFGKVQILHNQFIPFFSALSILAKKLVGLNCRCWAKRNRCECPVIQRCYQSRKVSQFLSLIPKKMMLSFFLYSDSSRKIRYWIKGANCGIFASFLKDFFLDCQIMSFRHMSLS